MKNRLPIEQHGIFQTNKHSVLTDKALRHQIESYIQAGNFTPDDYFKLVTGQFGHLSQGGESVIESSLAILQQLPDDNPSKHFLSDTKLNDKAVDFLAGHYTQDSEGHKRPMLHEDNALINTPEVKLSKGKALDIINHMEDYVDKNHNTGRVAGHMIAKLPKDKEVFQSAFLKHGKDIDLPWHAHGAIDPEHIEPHIIEHHIANLGQAGYRPDRDVSDLVTESPHLSSDHAKKIIEHSIKHGGYDDIGKVISKVNTPERKNFYDKLLGIAGGHYINQAPEPPKELEPDAAPDEIHSHKIDTADHANELQNWHDDENWQNWEPGKMHKEKVVNRILGSAKGLDDSHVEHIIRHGTPEQKYNLYQNPNLRPEHYQRMYNLWKQGNKPGWDQDEVANHLKSDEDQAYDDSDLDAAREEAYSSYPMSDFINDEYGDEDDARKMRSLVGQSKEDYINDRLEDHSWTAKNPKHIEGQDAFDPSLAEPQFVDYKNKHNLNIENHPEYNKRLEQANSAWNDAYEKAKSSPYDNESIQDQYDEHINDLDDIYQEAMDKKNARLANWFTDKDMVPSHIEQHVPEYATDLLQERKRKSKKARRAAATESNKEAQHLDVQVPNRPKEHEYAQGLHHAEMVRDHADANGGTIDIGHMNKLYPNQKENWKQIFAGKGKITSKEAQEKIDAIPKTKYDISHGVWDKNLQNINNRPQTIFRLDHSEDSENDIAKDPEVYKTFKKIQDASVRSGHPTNQNSIAWARVDTTDPKKWMIDELQSDFSSSIRRALEEDGQKDKADHVKTIEAAHKNWREALLNHITKTAKKNGVDLVYTHSPESKSSHTGADKVHSVYKDSYQKVPRSMGFKEANPEEMPLTNVGRRPFNSAISDENVADRIAKHKEALLYHSGLAGAHKHLIDKKHVNYTIDGGNVKDLNYDSEPRIDEHEQLLDHHAKLAQEHRSAIEQMDPLNEAVKIPIVKDVDRQLESDPERAISDMHNAKYHAQNFDDNMPKHPADEPLVRLDEPKIAAEAQSQHNGNVLDLRPAAFKKNIMVAEFLMKSDMSSDDKLSIAQALSNIQQQKEQIEALKQKNPQAYQAIAELTETLVNLFKEMTGEPIEAAQHEAEAQQGMDQSQSEEQTEATPRTPPQDKPITHGSKELPIGTVRDYNSKTKRTKSPDGEWVSTSSGSKTKDWQ